MGAFLLAGALDLHGFSTGNEEKRPAVSRSPRLVRRVDEAGDGRRRPTRKNEEPTMHTLAIAVSRGLQPATSQDGAARATTTAATSTSRGRVWAGRILSGLTMAFLLFDAVIKLLKPEMVIKGTVELGYLESSIVPIGLTLLACVALHLIPRTAIVGAVLITGYLGGAIATHVRVGNPLFSHTDRKSVV